MAKILVRQTFCHSMSMSCIYIYAKVVKSQTKKLTFYGFLSDDDIFRYDDVMQILVPMTFLIVFSLFCRLRAKKVYIERG